MLKQSEFGAQSTASGDLTYLLWLLLENGVEQNNKIQKKLKKVLSEAKYLNTS